MKFHLMVILQSALQLEYPSQVRPTCNMLQEDVCQYGSIQSGVDLTGHKKLKVTAGNQLTKYRNTVDAIDDEED